METAHAGGSSQINVKAISAGQASEGSNLFTFDTQPFEAIVRNYYCVCFFLRKKKRSRYLAFPAPASPRAVGFPITSH